MTTEVEELSGQAVLDALGAHLALLDGRIQRLEFEAALWSRPNVTLVVVPRERSAVAEATVRITLATASPCMTPDPH